MLDKLERKLYHGRLSPAVYRAREVAHLPRRPHLAPVDRAMVDALRCDGGYVTTLDELGYGSERGLLAGAAKLLAGLPDASRHASTISEGDGDALVGRNTFLHCFSVDPPEIARVAPEVLLWGLEERLLDAAEAYLGVPVAFTTVHLRKDVGNGRQVGTRYWHIDTEDKRVLRTIVYLDDVTADHGPFEYIPRPLTEATPESLKQRGFRSDGDPIVDDEMRRHVPESQWRTCTGPAGTVAIADNAAVYHHGRVHERHRVVLIFTHTSRHPLYPKLVRNPAFDGVLTPRQRACMFVPTS